jgi:DNA topoisomerase-2
MDITELVVTQSEEEFTRSKTVVAGTSDKITGYMYQYDTGKIVYQETTYIPSLFKIIDELIVNALDHFVLCVTKTTLQHKMKIDQPNRYVDLITFTLLDDGSMQIINTGYGIPIVKHKDYDMYLPQVLFSKQRTGTNMNADQNRITGGTNGIGATIVTAFSENLTLRICDSKSHYEQVMNKRNGVSHFEEPVIKPNNENLQYTMIRFLINWKNTNFRKFTLAVKTLFHNFIHKRLIQSRFYCEHVARVMGGTIRVPTIRFGAKETIAESMMDPASLEKVFGLIKAFSFKIDRKKNHEVVLTNSFSVVVGINTTNNLGYKEMSVINGVEVVRNPYITEIRKILIKAVETMCIQKKMLFGKAKLKNYFTIIMVGCATNPQWVGQTKEEFTVDKELLSIYSFAECETAKDKIAEIIYEMIICDEFKRKRKTEKPDLHSDIYQRCCNVNENGKRKNKNEINYLVLGEGVSAKNLITNIMDKKYKLSNKNTGILQTRGVPINVFHRMNWYHTSDFKHISTNLDPKIGAKLIIDKKAAENEFVKHWLSITGLPDCEPSFSVLNEAAERKMSYLNMRETLGYQQLICAADSDYDGRNIAGLFIVLLSKWPEVLKNGGLQILNLPIIRIIPNNLGEITKSELKKHGKLRDVFVDSVNFREYFNVSEFERDVLVNPVPSTHCVKYYKGLGTTETFFDTVIARNIDRYLYTILWDKNAEQTIETFYGKTKTLNENGEVVIVKLSDARKEILRRQPRQMTEAELQLYDKRFIAITTYLEIFVREYFADNIKRKLPKLMDGMNNVQTKISYALPRVIKSDKEILVSLIGPDVAKTTFYHHGADNVGSAIKNSGQQFPGAKIYTELIPSGKWGTRVDGGTKSSAHPRYIHAKLNRKFVDVLYRKEDLIVLPYQEEDGEMVEPHFLLPVFPMISLTNYKTTAHGWKIEIWAKDFNLIYGIIRKKLETLKTGKDFEIRDFGKYKLDLNRLNWRNVSPVYLMKSYNENSQVEQFTYSLGEYKIVEREEESLDVLYITDLPLGVWTDNYVSWIRSKMVVKKDGKVIHGDFADIVKSIDSFSVENVDIRIVLYTDWRTKISKLINREKFPSNETWDDVQIAFNLRVKLNEDLNIINSRGEVISYRNHYEVIADWFDTRLEFYRKRIERKKAIMQVEILKDQNRKRYLQDFSRIGTCRISKEEFNRRLESESFLKFRNINLKNLHANIIPNEDIMTFTCGEITEDKINMFQKLVDCGIIDAKATYKYLRTIPTGSVTDEKLKQLDEKIINSEKKLAELSAANITEDTMCKEITEMFLFVTENFGA